MYGVHQRQIFLCRNEVAFCKYIGKQGHIAAEPYNCWADNLTICKGLVGNTWQAW